MKTFLNRLRASLSAAPTRGASETAPVRLDISAYDTIYAVGDVHGCLELTRDLENKIHEAAGADAGPSAILYLGDVIDRGPKSAHVLDHLTRRHPAGLPRMCLRGNHEQFFLDFLEDPKGSLDWLDFGGRETLNSYGIYETRSAFERMGAADIKSILAASIPEAHAAYLRALPHFALGARVLFCHAGVNPTRGIPEQTAEDYMWARDRFLAHSGQFECLVVHGHTPVPRAEKVDTRVPVDTGAHETGLLSCAKVNPATGDVSFLTSNS